MSESREGIVFLSAVRTPFGTFGGSLKDITCTELTTFAAKEAIARSGISADEIDSAIFGNVLYTTAD